MIEGSLGLRIREESPGLSGVKSEKEGSDWEGQETQVREEDSAMPGGTKLRVQKRGLAQAIREAVLGIWSIWVVA